MAAETPQPPAQPRTKTRYRILRSNGSTWSEDGPMQAANNGDDAIKQAVQMRVENDVDASGTYVAIPERSWQPVPVTVAQTTVVKLGEAA